MEKSLKELAALLGGKVVGDENAVVSSLGTLDEATEGQITFLANPKYAGKVATTRATAVIVSHGAERFGRNVIEVKNPYLAFAKLLTLFHVKPVVPKGVMNGAFVGNNVTLGEGITVYPGAYVGDGVKLGNGSVLHPGVVLYEGVEVGENTVLHANVTVREGCRIGNRVIVHSGVVIGDFNVSETGHDNLSKLVLRAARRIYDFLPYKGRVLKIGEEDAVVNLGLFDGVSQGDLLAIFRKKSGALPVQSKILLKVSEADTLVAAVTPVNAAELNLIELNDAVYPLQKRRAKKIE